MGLGLNTNNEQLIGTLSSSALGQTHQYKQGLLRGANQLCYSNLDTHDFSINHANFFFSEMSTSLKD